MKRLHYAAIALACALTACGGGGNSGVSKTEITTVKVAGASLADSGAFGFKFTVQGPNPSTPFSVYPERIASTYGAAALCPAYLGKATTPNAAPTTGCTNYAVAGASVNAYDLTAHAQLPTYPVSGVKQLADMAAAGSFGNKDLVIVGELAANDVATLVEAYSALATGGTDFQTMLLTLLDSTTVSTYMGTAQGRAALGVLYMQKVADKLRDAINTHLLAHGAQRVAVLNTLDVTYTPRLQASLALLRSTESLPSNHPSFHPPGSADAFQAMVRAWVQGFNTQLATDLAPYSSKVAIVDFYTNFSAEMADPAQYGLKNVTNTVCDEIVNAGTTTSVSTAGATKLTTPSTVAACNATAASALTPHQDGGSSTWWQGYLFADYFHPTPYGHQLLAQLVAKRLTEAGWL
ncbi:MAG: hypothetical protein RI920_1316 [Pseudomonadota bacterium]|jgi:phospholipase/lecithinase/hemolysin